MTDTAWHEWRRNGIGASDVAGVLGTSPWASPWSVWAAKVGAAPPLGDDDTSTAMRLGKYVEALNADEFTRATGLHVAGEQTWCTHPVEAWARATVDGFVVDHEGADLASALGVFESKFTADGRWTEVPAYYVEQVQWQMFVTGHERAWLGVLHVAFGRTEFVVYEVERDQVVIDAMVDVCGRFWRTYVVTGAMPPTDDHPATADAVATVYGHRDVPRDSTVELDAETERTVFVWRDLKGRAKELADEVKACETAIRAALGERANGTVDGNVVVSWRPQSTNRLDAKALAAAHPALVDEFTRPSISRVLRHHETKG